MDGDGEGGGRGGDDEVFSLEVREGDDAALVLFGAEREAWRTRRSVADAVFLYDYCRGRRVVLDGRVVGDGER